MDQTTDWLTRHGIDAKTTLGTLAILVIGSAIILSVTRFLRGLLRRTRPRLPVQQETALMVLRVISGALWVLLGTTILEFWGLSVSGLWAVFASAAAVVGVGFLATWTLVSNATASLFITIWRPFRLGQHVELLPESLKGRAIDRNLMFTALREGSGSVLQIPNSLFFQKMFRVADSTDQYLFEFLENTGEHAGAPADGPETVVSSASGTVRFTPPGVAPI